MIARARGYISALEYVIEDLEMDLLTIKDTKISATWILDEVKTRVEQDLRQAQQTLDVMLSMDQETSTATETETE